MNGKRVEAKRELLRVGRGSGLLAGCGGRGAALVAGLLLESAVPPARGVTLGGEVRACVSVTGLLARGHHLRPMGSLTPVLLS